MAGLHGLDAPVRTRAPFWRGPACRVPWEPRWEDDPRNRAWLDEIEAAITAGDLARLEAAQAAVRLAPEDRPPLGAGAARAVQYRPLAAAVEDVQLPPWEPDEPVEEVQVAPPGPPVKKLRGAYARRAGS